MAKHKKYDLLDIIINAVRDSDWNVLFVSSIHQHPFVLKIYKEETSYPLRIYIWHLTHGGGAQRPADEYRIQITGVTQFEHIKGEKTLILGWWEEGSVFAGFDYTRHSGVLGSSPSIQIREEALRKAHINGMASHDKGNREIAIAFRPDFFIEYLENLESLHDFGSSKDDHEILEQVFDEPDKVNENLIEKVSKTRKIAVATITKKLRDGSFKSRVLTAYGNRCAFCSLQLKLVDAAHIIPVSDSKSTDETSNGIALCTLHHRAFDRTLITLNEKYQILVNESELEKLSKMTLDGEKDRFCKDLRHIIHVPPALSDRPHKTFIRQANKIRGWNLTL